MPDSIIPNDDEELTGLWNSPPPTSILHTISGFTPIFDHLARKHGLVRAAVYGRMWRYCQMKDGVCNASLETIAADIGIDRATVQRHANALVKTGYMKDLSADLRNRPHTYADTGKVRMVSTTTARPTVAQCNTTVAESRMKKVLKKEKKEERAQTPRPRDFLFDSICEVCQVDPATAGASIGKVRATLGKATPPYTPDEVRAFAALWWADYGRKKPPTLWNLQEQIGRVRMTGKLTSVEFVPTAVYE